MISVLIVVDSDDLRRKLRTVLEGVADPIYECGDGAEAGALYAAHRPDWVLMDLAMVPVDGITATRRIIQSFPDARVVMVAQYGDAPLRDAAREAGACGYLSKDNLLDVRRFLAENSRPGGSRRRDVLLDW